MRPVLYAVNLPPALEPAWRDAVHELGSDHFAQAMNAAGIAADGKKTLIAWLRCDATRALLAAFRWRFRAERDRLHAQDLGYWDNAHVDAVAIALADQGLHRRLVELLLRQMRKHQA